MTTLYLMRHAEAQLAEGQDEEHLFSLGDEPLSEEGRAQAHRAGELLADADPPVDAIHTSPTERCKETAEILAEALDVEAATHAALREVPFGEPGTPYQRILAEITTFARSLRGSGDHRLPGGETASGSVERYRRVLEDTIRAQDEAPLVVGHGAQNRAYIAQLLGMPLHRLFRLEQDHAAVNVVRFTSERRVLLKMNTTEPPLFTEASSLLSEHA